MVESIIKDEGRIFPVCAKLKGEYGLKDMFLGVPVQLGKKGIERIIELDLNKEELSLLNNSADHVRKVMGVFNSMNV